MWSMALDRLDISIIPITLHSGLKTGDVYKTFESRNRNCQKEKNL